MLSFQLTSKMAALFRTSQLLLIALFGWNVYCVPAKGWSQRDPGSFSNIGAQPGFRNHPSQGAPAQPSGVSYPAAGGVYSGPGTYPASSSSFPGMSGGAAPHWDPVEGSTTASRTSQPSSVAALPPPPFFEAGTLDHYEANFELGNSERESEELTSFPAPPLPPLPYPDYQAGDLSQYSSIFVHGSGERETEEQGFRPPPYPASAPQGVEMSAAVFTSGHTQPAPRGPTPPGSFQRYLFLTGQLPPGTYSHYDSDYETGVNHWDESHYERYHYPAPSQQPQDYTKI